jgi:hypothetical protein
MTIKYYIYLVIGAAIFGGLFYVNNLKTVNKELRRQKIIYEAQINGLNRNLKAQTDALKAREIENTRLTAESNKLKGQLSDVYKNDPLANAWAIGLMPDAVCSELCQ